MTAGVLLTAAVDSIDTELIEVAGSIAAILAAIGLLLLLPIYITHRREVERLLDWMDQEPEAGTTEFRAIPMPSDLEPRSTGRTGEMTPAERVTSERPALKRIATGEYAAIELEPTGFWQRVIERGPRHPLVLTIIAVLIGVVAVVIGSQLITNDDEGGGGGGVDPATVTVAVVNGTSEPGVANKFSDQLETKGFVIASNDVSPDGARKTAVYYAPDQKAKGRAVARVLKLARPTPFKPEQEAAAGGADVVVVVGEDSLPEDQQDDGGGGGDGANAEDEAAIDPETGEPIEPIDPATGEPIEPAIDPATGEPVAP